MWKLWRKNKKKSDPKLNNMNLDYNKSKEELLEDLNSLEFQWIKGENAGGIEYFSRFVTEGDLEFLVFDSGNRLNKDLVSEYMETFPKAPVNLSGLPSDIKKAQVQTNPANRSEVNTINYNKTQRGLGVQLDKSSPIYGLLNKQKPNMVDVDISIKINLPPKELYSVLTNSFDGAESEIVEYVIASLNIEDIKKSLSESILNTYYEVKEGKL